MSKYIKEAKKELRKSLLKSGGEDMEFDFPELFKAIYTVMDDFATEQVQKFKEDKLKEFDDDMMKSESMALFGGVEVTVGNGQFYDDQFYERFACKMGLQSMRDLILKDKQ